MNPLTLMPERYICGTPVSVSLSGLPFVRSLMDTSVHEVPGSGSRDSPALAMRPASVASGGLPVSM